MTMITRLVIQDFRVLRNVTLDNLAPCNVFVGANGSGKTSLLESVFLLSRGKSFRHHQPKHYINHNTDKTTVFAQFAHAGNIAVEKNANGESKLRLHSTPIATQSQLTSELPVLLLDPTQLDILDHGSGERRALLDWLVFHIKPEFYKTWLNYQRALKQRNRLLKMYETFDAMPSNVRMQMEAWQQQLAQLGDAIHAMRLKVVEQWEPIFKRVCMQFLPQYPSMFMRYSAGFDTEKGLQEVMAERSQKDVELGYTRVGVHRADVLVFTQEMADDERSMNKSAPDVFSRGEKKLLIMALKLSQLLLLRENKKCALVLLDDINAELDESAVNRLLQGLHACDSQVFMTSLTTNIMPIINELWNDARLHKVENGLIQATQ